MNTLGFIKYIVRKEFNMSDVNDIAVAETRKKGKSTYYDVNIKLPLNKLISLARKNNMDINIENGNIMLSSQSEIIKSIINTAKELNIKDEINNYEVEGLLNAIINKNIGNNDAIRRIRMIFKTDYNTAFKLLQTITILISKEFQN